MSPDNGQIVTGLILERRSVRGGFTKQEVTREIIEQILECGNNAPSSKNSQPWKYYVVTDVKMLEKIATTMTQADGVVDFRPLDPRTGKRRTGYVSTVIESAGILRSVPLAIFLENRGTFMSSRADVWRAEESIRAGAVVGLSLDYLGLGMCVCNMWLAGQAHGLCGVFMADVLIAEDFIKDMLGIKGDLVGVLCLGYSDMTPRPKRTNRNNAVWHVGT
ncbi:hypothetical protein A3A21_03255 [Candidatus Jorgensenbacteria bacterium RIFCSPLOWO2_01_FULL_45_25b]|uniref:Nitroreductase domain-containing protein n=1 Tax=Candidatus Jorgensenbacteria bacterium RIFCSPLOWO2_01_FULL_45_25b TaxID=1798471 RepID=A0A1F6BTY4_9BACT|nr:MAG: hypothetical protein A3A21_03255 [Candidatus Jorgensenbacteria bacterium RIFCSPLOWO2_01_FULL_45_25b]